MLSFFKIRCLKKSTMKKYFESPPFYILYMYIIYAVLVFIVVLCVSFIICIHILVLIFMIINTKPLLKAFLQKGRSITENEQLKIFLMLRKIV